MARPVKLSEDGPRPGPAHQIFRGWAADRPGPAHHMFKNSQPGPAQFIIFSKASARPGPSHGSEAHETRDLYRPARQLRRSAVDVTGRSMGRPMCCSVLKGAYACADVIFYVNCWFFVVFSRLDSVGQLLSAYETHNQYPLLTQFCSINDSVVWVPADHHLLVMLQRPLCCCNTRRCCNTCCCNTLYRAKITPAHAVIFWRRLPTLQQQQSSSRVRHPHT